jgi:hypothetical protein
MSIKVTTYFSWLSITSICNPKIKAYFNLLHIHILYESKTFLHSQMTYKEFTNYYMQSDPYK